MGEENNHFLIVGITGTYAAGKDTAASYLASHYGFVHFSLSDILREELNKRGLESTRDNLIAVGKEIREKYGMGELSRRVIKKIEEQNLSKVVVTSIRNPGEIDAFREETDNFHLIAIDAPRRLRFERAKARGNLADEVDFQTFVRQEESEMATTGPGQQLGVCISMADFEIINDKELADFYQQLDEVLSIIGVN